ncbi:hypothetical protein OROMI_013420 [Orobanche minor]
MEMDHYTAWAELFKLHARSHRVLALLFLRLKGRRKPLRPMRSCGPLSMLRSSNGSMPLTTMEAWDRLHDIFLENHNFRVVALEHDFSHVKMRDYPNVSAYCQRLKSLSDQLKSVGAPVFESFVLELINGLMEAYKNVGTHIRQSKSLPSFSDTRSSLRLEEKALIEMMEDFSSAMMAASPREFDGQIIYSAGYLSLI